MASMVLIFLFMCICVCIYTRVHVPMETRKGPGIGGSCDLPVTGSAS